MKKCTYDLPNGTLNLAFIESSKWRRSTVEGLTTFGSNIDSNSLVKSNFILDGESLFSGKNRLPRKTLNTGLLKTYFLRLSYKLFTCPSKQNNGKDVKADYFSMTSTKRKSQLNFKVNYMDLNYIINSTLNDIKVQDKVKDAMFEHFHRDECINDSTIQTNNSVKQNEIGLIFKTALEDKPNSSFLKMTDINDRSKLKNRINCSLICTINVSELQNPKDVVTFQNVLYNQSISMRIAISYHINDWPFDPDNSRLTSDVVIKNYINPFLQIACPVKQIIAVAKIGDLAYKHDNQNLIQQYWPFGEVKMEGSRDLRQQPWQSTVDKLLINIRNEELSKRVALPNNSYKRLSLCQKMALSEIQNLKAKAFVKDVQRSLPAHLDNLKLNRARRLKCKRDFGDLQGLEKLACLCR